MGNVINTTQERELQYLKEIFGDINELNKVINEELEEMNDSISLNENLDKKLMDICEDDSLFNIQNKIVNIESKKKELSISAKNLMVQKHIISNYIK